MKVTILTLFPEMFQGPFSFSILKIIQEKNLAQIVIVNIRDFGIGKHKVVDDTPYGGGKGMLMRVDVLHRAIEKVMDKNLKSNDEKVILMGAKGKVFNQKTAISFSKLKHLIIVCGHYEGVDARIYGFIDEEVSIGDFILTGGEIPAMLVTDAVLRLIVGALPKDATEEESFSTPYLEHPQYTKPRVFKKKGVPDVLLSGNHAEIKKWKKEKSLEATKKLRPDLLAKN